MQNPVEISQVENYLFHSPFPPFTSTSYIFEPDLSTFIEFFGFLKVIMHSIKQNKTFNMGYKWIAQILSLHDAKYLLNNEQWSLGKDSK